MLDHSELSDDASGSFGGVSIDPKSTGFLFVEFMDAYSDYLHVDGQHVSPRYGQLGVRGMAPRGTLLWSLVPNSISCRC